MNESLVNNCFWLFSRNPINRHNIVRIWASDIVLFLLTLIIPLVEKNVYVVVYISDRYAERIHKHIETSNKQMVNSYFHFMLLTAIWLICYASLLNNLLMTILRPQIIFTIKVNERYKSFTSGRLWKYWLFTLS